MTTPTQLPKSWAIAKKDLAIYYLKGPVVVFGLLLPAFLFFSFAIGKNLPFSDLFPSLLGMSLFFSVSAIGPMIAPWETRLKTFERLVSTPVALWAIILGDIIASFLFGLVIMLVVFGLGVALLGTHILNAWLLTSVLLTAFCFSALGSLMSAPPVDEPSQIMMLSSLIKYPLILAILNSVI